MVILAEELDRRLEAVDPEGGVDVVVDPVGGTLRRIAFDHLAPFGCHLVLGNASGESVPFSDDDTWLQTRTVAGLSVGGTAHLRPASVAEALAAIVSLVGRRSLVEPPPAVVALDRAREVHSALEERTAPAKTVLAVAPRN